MGDINQLIFIQKHKEELSKPFLEVGSKNYGTTQNLREFVDGVGEYIGVDMEDGLGVDMVLNLTDDFEKIDAKLSGKRFNTIFCLSVLEHCEQPFKMAENLTRLLMPNGRIFLSVPFSWKIHAYPSDFWRFTPEGVKKTFSKIRNESRRWTCLHF